MAQFVVQGHLITKDEIPPLDEKYYGLDETETAFFKQQTGISDDDELKKHIVRIQAEAYEVYPYPCIRRFTWTKLKISKLFPYKDFLRLGAEREGAIYLDLGCCFGNDPRKAIADGYPAQNVVASDLYQAFWDLGQNLFKTTSETYPVTFVAGDAFDPAHLETVPPFTIASPPTTPRPILSELKSLNPLRGHVSAIHTSSFFHLFDENGQQRLAHAVAGLLSPEPGSMIFGQHSGLPQKGFRMSSFLAREGFAHGPDSWRELWDGEVFAKGTVKVETELKEVDSRELKFGEFPEGFKSYLFIWKVIRL
ncbi:hypothetical protein OF83DRAFT_1167835 [Amylostereum chailletii]|nr:hypothetical protein OF83DRAFT_1167835 [Amylostereum chailletii]